MIKINDEMYWGERISPFLPMKQIQWKVEKEVIFCKHQQLPPLFVDFDQQLKPSLLVFSYSIEFEIGKNTGIDIGN